MKNMLKRTLAVLVAVIMTFGSAPLNGFVGLELPDWFDFSKLFEVEAEAATYSGTCGSNLTWTLDTSTGVLQISGTGAMKDYSSSNTPWYSYRSNVKTVKLGNGVTSIGNYAFYYCDSLTSITIPNSVTSIGDYAFSYCASLISITIPDSVTSIGDYAFRDCDSLTSITIPDSVTTIGRWAFYNCDSLTSITIPDSVTSIGNGAFYSCGNLASVTIPDSVTSIGYESFSFCTSLTSITIPDSVTSIGGYAFNNCDSLTSITIPDSVTTIGRWAFYNCDSLTSIKVDSNNKYYSSDSYGVLFNKNKTNLIQYPIGNSRTSYTIPDSVTTIGVGAFYECDSLTNVTIPDSVTSIGDAAFRYCTNLTSMTIPDSVTSIGNSAFSDCTSLTSITIPDSVTSIGDAAFYECDSLTNVTIPDSVTSIGDAAFRYCTNLTSMTIPDSVTSIGNSAFSDCTSLTSITIPDSVTSIGGYAFNNCDSLTNVTIPDSATSIGYYAFYNCTSLTSIIIPDSATSIGDYAFSDCESLTSVTIGDSVTSIGDGAFNKCASLTSITIPDSVTGIGYGAFRFTAFYGNNSNWENDVLYIGNHLIEAKTTLSGSYSVKKETKTIAEGTFCDCTSLTSITIPDSVTSIGDGAFEDCTSLTSVTIPDSVTSIGDYTFAYCDSLTSITIPDSVTSIGNYAFYYCDSLKDVYFTGSEDEWSAIAIGSYNECLTNATIHFNSPGSHVHSYTATSVTAPTCTAQGYTTFTCSECGDTYQDKYVNALGHACSEKTTAPTCTAQGYKTFTCTRSGCSYSYIGSYTSATGHSYGNWVVTAATCEKAGSRYKVCSKCSNKVTESIPKLEHVYESVVTPPSCGKEGYTTHTCVNCGNSYKDNYITAPDHTYGSWITEKQPTCTSTGLKYKKCTCGDRVEETIPALGHSYKTTVTKPTHADDGYTTYTCTRSSCSYSKKGDYVAAIGHTYGGWITDTAATCAKEGKRHKECSCGDKVEETIPKLAHSYKSSTVAPTCTAKGYTKFTCSGCGDTYKENYVSAKGHSYGSWVTETQATCAAEGKRYKVCSACSNKVEETIPKLAHSYTDSVTAPTCTKEGYTTHTCSACGHSYTDTATNSLGHSYGDWKTEKQATCSAEGLKYKECSRCKDRIKEKIPVTDHSYILSDTEPTCTEKGYTTHACKNCSYSYDDTFVQAYGHSYGEWNVDREASVLREGLRHRICEVCEFKDEQSISKVTVDVESNTNYGLAVFTVVNAQTLKPIQNAQIFISTENDGENTFRTDENGKVSVVMPVGKQKVSVYADGCLTRNLTVNILSETNNIPQIGLSDTKTYNAEIKHHVMTKEEIEDAGIDVSATENKHVVKYEVEISYEAEVDTFSLTYYMDDDDKIIGGGGTAEKDGETVSVTWVDDGNDKGHFYIPSNKPDEPDTTIYPAAENFYLIIRGEVKWLKEIFDVEMLVINNSNTDTLEDLTATLTLPEGLSLAKMAGDPQSLEQKVENVAGGKTQSVHWYVRGDKEGSYGLEVRLQGNIVIGEGVDPEPIDDVFVAENNIQVYAGSALNLHFEFPSAAYYGEDYPITITLTNVSDRTLYNVNHMVQIEQGMDVFYSDGSSKEKIETSDWKAFGVEEFNPGDKIIIETSVNIFFESEIMQAKIESFIGTIDGLEQLVEAYKAVNTAVNIIDGLESCVSGCIKALDDFVASPTVSKAKAELFKQLHSKLSGLYSKYSKSGSKTFDAVAGLANSGISTTLNVITNDPQDWLEKHSEDDIKSLLKKITALESAMNAEESSQKFNIFDSLRTAISAIPIMFAFSDITMTEGENNTTSIPWSYTVSKASPHYFGVSNVSKYLTSLVQVMLGEVYSDAVPSYLQLISGVDDPFNTNEAINYIKATEKEIAHFKAKDATGKVTFRAWIERSETGAKARTSSVSDDFVLTTDNDSAKYENGVLTFTGDGMISVQPQNTTGGTLYVEDSEGNVYTYVIEVVEAHTCKAGAQNMVIAPTDEYDGFAVKCCDTCGEIMEVINLTKEDCCSTHSFGKWETESEATCSAEGINTRTCSNCGFVEYQFVAASGHAISSHKITKASTCTEKGVMTYYCSCGESYTEEIIETGHTFSTWNTTKEATCEETGLKTAVCSVCKQTVEEVIPETGHIDADSNGKCDVCTQDPEPEDEEQVTLKSISVYSEPTKKDYYLGESLDTSGLKLKLTYSDGTTKIVSDGFSTNGFSSVSSGTKTVTVYYNGLKTSFDIEINTVSINIAEESKSMFIGDTYKLSATTVPDGQEIIWKSSDENIVTVSNGVVTAVSDGNATVTASIVVGGKTYSASCTVVVSDPKGVVTSVTIVDEKLKTDYYVGDPLNTSGLQLEITYADGTKEIISSGFATNGFDSSDAGSKTVVVEYGEFTLNYDITVKPAEERKALYSGTCGAQGDNLTWTLYENGQLVIDGTGDMEDYRYNYSAPWKQYSEYITEVLICDGVTSIGNYMFEDCTSLTSITIPDSVTSIGYYAFYSCTSLTSITIPDSVTSIGNSAFYGCESLTSITIPDGVTSIGNYAFYGCESLTSITIPDSVTSIGNYAFRYCESLTSIIIPDSVTSIGDYTFAYCTSLTSITIPDSVTSIGYYAFYDCGSLTSITIPDSVISIGNGAFCACESLTSITIPDGVTSIGNYAFYGCESLTSIAIPDSVTSIGYYAFSGCESLTSITIPDSVTSIGNYAFRYCESLTSITIPDSVTSIGDELFYECTSLTSITIPDSVTSIGYYAFYGCGSLTSITIPDSVTSIGNSAFSGCESLTSITIPDSVTSIGNSAFSDCKSLTSITIPDSVTSIGSSAFYLCYSLADVYFTGSQEEWKAISVGTYNDILKKATVHYNYVPLVLVSVLTLPDKEGYYVGDTLNTNGLTLTATYSNGTTKTVTSGFTCSPTKLETAGTQKITVTYGGKTTSFNVTVKEVALASIAVKSNPTKTSYFVGDTLNTSGLTLTATYNNGTTKVIGEGFTCTPEKLYTAGTQEITVTFGGKTTSFNVTVKEVALASIAVKTNPTKTSYYVGDTLNTSGLTLTATYNNSTTKTITSGFTCTPTTLNTVGAQRITVSYGGKTTSFDVTVDNVTLTSIAVKTNPDKTNYYLGDTLDTSGLTLTATYNNGKTETISSGFTCTPTKLETAGTQKITVTYGGKTTSFDVTVDNVTLTSIAVKTNPDKTNYYLGDTLDTSGLTLTATYNNGKTETISSGFTCTPTKLETAGTQKITVTYGGKTISFNVTVEDVVVSSIAVKNEPNNTSYYVGDSLDTTGLTLTATYNNGTTKTVSSGFTCTPTTLSSAGTQKITITYGGKTTSFNVTVENVVLTSVAVKTVPAKTSYFVGDTLDTSGLTLTATYNNGTTKTISSGFTCTPEKLETAGTQKITVTYGDKSTSFNVEVKAVEVSGISIASVPETLSYYVGDTLSTEGLSILVTYNNGTVETITSGFTCSPSTLNTEGTQKITVTYGGKTATFNVSVAPVKVTELEIVTAPHKTSYKVGDKFDPTGLTMNAVNSKGEEIVVTEGFVCTPEILEKSGTQVVTVTYGGKSVMITIVVEEEKAETYAVKFISNGIVISEEEYEAGEAIAKPEDPTLAGYKFMGWTPDVPTVMPEEALTFTAKFEKSYICPDCGDEILGEAEINAHIAAEARMKATVKIKNNPGSRTIKYGEILRLTAITNNMPADAKIYWYVDGVKRGEGTTFEVSPTSGSVQVTVKLVDSRGNVLENANGDEISDSQKVAVNAGFFQKLISFFKNLFGMNRTLVQVIKTTF